MALSDSNTSSIAELNIVKEQFKVLKDQFLEQRSQLYAATKNRENGEYVADLEQKLKQAQQENEDLKQIIAMNQVKAGDDLKDLLVQLETEREKNKANVEEGYWNLTKVGLLMEKLSDRFDESEERMLTNCQYAKTYLEPQRIQETIDRYLILIGKTVKTKKESFDDLTKQLEEANKNSAYYKKKFEESESQMKFDARLTAQIQEKINQMSISLESNKKLVAELEEEKKKGQRLAEGVLDNPEENHGYGDEVDGVEEDQDDKEDQDDEN
ncbi:hypothetical protein B9Z55_014220 [Caenorhabditis nigoni]|uniref:Uncharacterized protein n=1 Tax=Caenorhabditis nigoni TaxID=1611254 RepID=A0A2G5U505_9PELO|nr:hypothetical protein B9Z55_014220 [Caenorhabditis nigoni]